ncbi:sensor domain-containing phosphodiesterase [Uliginosibacterium gangwonense]|uniref:sensor domain-containing phosphodiesterase n=1 Tax=Uliginosibacterium gangwonense TaxID=392736 RepID=UPI0003672F60|nr:EAL domain-containing protein [Uliginosibacterium gangwonense]
MNDITAQWLNLPTPLEPYLLQPAYVDGRLTIGWNSHRLSSVYQPIVSFSHSSVVGHEALVRVQTADGASLPPPSLFEAARALGETVTVDRACRVMHTFNAQDTEGWLFLNVHPNLFATQHEIDGKTYSEALTRHFGLEPHRAILEVTEESVSDLERFEEGISGLRELGMGLAIDDFGAGHSNFDRIWHIQPDVVKLDRSFAVRAIQDDRVRRMLPRLVDLLHETGAMVLLEGIETEDQALIAMDADVDFGQGYYFAHPKTLPSRSPYELAERMGNLWRTHDVKVSAREHSRRAALEPYIHAIAQAAQCFADGCGNEDAAKAYLTLPMTQCFYVLDHEGHQIGQNLNAPRGQGSHILLELGRMPGARWSRRQYFKRAIAGEGRPQVTRPYASLTTGRICVTISTRVERDGAEHVVCGDVDWEAMSQSTD